MPKTDVGLLKCGGSITKPKKRVKSEPCASCAKLWLDAIAVPGYTPSKVNRMPTRLFALLALAVSSAFCQSWNPRLAEQYMDSRLKEWAAWPNAQVSGVVCV